MAMWRSGARQAPRHTGRQYDSGYQFKYPTRALLSFGPWDSVWPLGDRELPRSVLRSLQDGMLTDGIIMPIWRRTETELLDQRILGATELPIGDNLYGITAYKTPAEDGVLHMIADLGIGAPDDDASLLEPSDEPISMTSWQGYIYFVQEGLGEVKRYDPLLHAFATVAASPTDSKFAFILHNNLVLIRKNGLVWEAVWSVDSSPEDFASAGSGAAILGEIGEVRGVGVLSDRAVIVGSTGAKLLVPTNSLPAFAVIDIAAIEGTPFDRAVTSSKDTMYYVGYDRQVYSYGDQGHRQVGDGEGQIIDAPRLFYSRRLGQVIVTIPESDITLFLNTQTGKWVSNLPLAWDYFADHPALNDLGILVGYENMNEDVAKTHLDLDPTTFTLPVIKLGNIDLDAEYILDYIDVHRTHTDSPLYLLLDLWASTRFNHDQLISVGSEILQGVEEIGQKFRFYVNRPVMGFNTIIRTQAEEVEVLPGPFLLSLMDGSGNVPVDADNPVSGQRGDLEGDGNLDISNLSTEYYGTGIDGEGNLDLALTAQMAWLRNTGIDKVEFKLKKQVLEEVHQT